ncbi:MAG TPA: monovalent cation/H+ antiporter complex subunit F [Acidimicrobiales bacterium]|nr:monovalent cation/H+ antiporter complex subunit F [Acidimicrobiales bacterium]
MTPLTYAVLVVAFALFTVRLGRGPSLADRVLAVDGMLVAGVGILLVNAMDTGRGAFLQVAVLLTLVGFISTAVIARFIEGRGE